MNSWTTVSDVFPTRRELLKYGGFGLLGASTKSIWPLKLGAATVAGETNPRGNAQSFVCMLLVLQAREKPVSLSP